MLNNSSKKTVIISIIKIYQRNINHWNKIKNNNWRTMFENYKTILMKMFDKIFF